MRCSRFCQLLYVAFHKQPDLRCATLSVGGASESCGFLTTCHLELIVLDSNRVNCESSWSWSWSLEDKLTILVAGDVETTVDVNFCLSSVKDALVITPLIWILLLCLEATWTPQSRINSHTLHVIPPAAFIYNPCWKQIFLSHEHHTGTAADK